MEVMIQTLPIIQLKFDHDFNFKPFSKAPSSPKRRFADSVYFSAPTSPTTRTTRASEFSSVFHDHDDDDDDDVISSKSVIPFDWEEKPGTPKSFKSVKDGDGDDYDGDFAFDFSVDLEKKSLSADELFHGGQIKPLKPPPGGLNMNEFAQNQNPISPKSPKTSFFSSKKKQSDKKTEHRGNENRGRETFTKNSSRRGSRRETRSLSPYRVKSHYPFDKSDQIPTTNSSKTRKWSLKNFLLFRSASEGRAAKDHHHHHHPLRKYFSFFSIKHDHDHDHDDDDDDGGSVKHSRLRQGKTESFNSGLMKKNRGGGSVLVSAHELHYTENRAVSEELKKRSFLPYKHGIMGRFSFNHHVSN